MIEGWLQGVAPKLLAHPKNLQLLWCTDNIAKGARMDFSIAEFYWLIGETPTQAGVMSNRNDNVFSLDEDFQDLKLSCNESGPVTVRAL